MSDEKKLAGPVSSVENEPYWEAARNGKLLIKHCNSCQKNHFYPRSICPFCFSSDTSWLESSGKGTIYSHSTTYMEAEPYILAFVTLAEGPTMLTNIVGSTPPKIGQSVSLQYLETTTDPVPVFAAA